MAVAGWIREQRRIYFGNATSVRDYRAQLRGVRASLFWAAYLGLLILFVTVAYWNIVSQGRQSVAQIQSELKSFYNLILVLLEVMVALVAPVIVGMSIHAERRRQSLDLILTAPVSPKYFLIGKFVSGYRYIVMLLFLSLPITAAAVVLGGATWSEVLISYVLIATHALLLMAISLPIALLSPKVVSAVIYSYMGCWAVFLVGSTFSAGMMFTSGFGGLIGSQEGPFWPLMFPNFFGFGIETHTTMFGAQVPNWILAVAMTLFIVKFFVLAGGSVMTRAGSKETVSLRIHGLVIAALLSFILTRDSIASGGFSSGPAAVAYEFAIMVSVLTLPLVVILPHISTWSFFDERKTRPNGVFSLRAALTSAPEGGLPYLMMLVAAVIMGPFVSTLVGGDRLTTIVWPYLIWLAGGWAFFWSLGWLLSSFVTTGIATARKSQLAFTVIIAVLPWPVIAMLSAAMGTSSDGWIIYPLTALAHEPDELLIVMFMASEFWLLAAVFGVWGEWRRKNVVSSYVRRKNEAEPARPWIVR
ncbi:MAG: ABC transporter permease [Armatimonadetes bacterium]|nr:ABC transporter permease [Armatimonadota bacterium]